MTNSPQTVFEQYKTAADFKAALGKHGLFEQNKINERFFVGDQWHGAQNKSEKPLVRHNVIRRIGDYKIAEILSAPVELSYCAEGFSQNEKVLKQVSKERSLIAQNGATVYAPVQSENEVALMVSALNSYRKTTEKRVGFNRIIEQALKDAYITGTGAVYTYYDPTVKTGLFADKEFGTPIMGDIVCQRVRVEDIYFADPAITNLQNQPYIILAEEKPCSALAAEAEKFGASAEFVAALKEKGQEKTTLLTKLYKQTEEGKTRVFATKVTQNGVVRPDFSIGVSAYPLCVFSWERREDCIYGDSEITYLIPNQIAINRMITAGVWSAMSSGMPLMVVNGDLVGGEITNEPGQVIKVFGSAEEIGSAVNYINPPDHSSGYNQMVETLIYNTLTQSGANEAALGDIDLNNTSAIVELREASAKHLAPLKGRFYRFLEDIANVWGDFFFAMYGKRCLKICDELGVWYFPFNAERYSNLVITVSALAQESVTKSAQQTIALLQTLLDKGAINAVQFLSRMPQGLVPNLSGLISELEKENSNERI